MFSDRLWWKQVWVHQWSIKIDFKFDFGFGSRVYVCCWVCVGVWCWAWLKGGLWLTEAVFLSSGVNISPCSDRHSWKKPPAEIKSFTAKIKQTSTAEMKTSMAELKIPTAGCWVSHLFHENFLLFCESFHHCVESFHLCIESFHLCHEFSFLPWVFIFAIGFFVSAWLAFVTLPVRAGESIFTPSRLPHRRHICPYLPRKMSLNSGRQRHQIRMTYWDSQGHVCGWYIFLLSLVSRIPKKCFMEGC